MKPEKPPVIKSPIAYNGDKRPIPASTPLGSNQLSFESGFPVLTATPLKAGGLPPDRLDFNAALNLLSSFTFFMQSGNQFSWNAELDYNPGAFVLGSDEALYFCTQANGATPPNTVKNPTTTTGYWVKVFSKQGVFNNDLIADGSITTAKIAAGAINNAKISDVSASKVTGVLPVANGGNGTNTGISQAVQNALNGKQATGDYATNARVNAVETTTQAALSKKIEPTATYTMLHSSDNANVYVSSQAIQNGESTSGIYANVLYNELLNTQTKAQAIIQANILGDSNRDCRASMISWHDKNSENARTLIRLSLSSVSHDCLYMTNTNKNYVYLGEAVRLSGNAEIAPKPNTTGGIGKIEAISASPNLAIRLPGNSGTWAYILIHNLYENGIGSRVVGMVTGVDAGGAFVAYNETTAPYEKFGVAWRIA